MPEVILEGCTPEPLMNYLKALGVLRLISEQADSEARACWRNDVFVLSSALDRDGVFDFFLNCYQPTPIVAPWAGGSGFFTGDNRKAVDALARDNVSPRCHRYRDVIHHVRQILHSEQITAKPKDADKDRLLRRYRRELPLNMVQWMDAAMVLQETGPIFAPLLGTGGNDGRLDFSQNFMGRLVELGLHQQTLADHARSYLEHALFAKPVSRLPRASVGQFAPGRAGGPNATQGMEGDSMDNPWEFVLMIEGTLCLAGAAVRRLEVSTQARASLPFTVMASPVGCASAAEADTARSRGELWLPVWTRPTRLVELRALFGEGRALVGRRIARNGVEFARAVATLGIDRGIYEFVRTGFLQRSGKAYLAVALGRMAVPGQPRSELSLLEEIDGWLDRYRSASTAKSPARFRTALHEIERAIFDLCRYGGRSFIATVLTTLGHAERQLALSAGKIGNQVLFPLVGLSPAWLEQSNDSTQEFEIARALAAIVEQPGKIGPLRAYLEPLDWQHHCRKWAEKGRSVVWNSADLATNMAAVLSRRLMDAQKAGCESLPIHSNSPASLAAIAAFLAGNTDNRKIEDLLWGLNLVQPQRLNPPPTTENFLLPRTYALLKLLFLPCPLQIGQSEYTIRPEPRILPLLVAGRIDEASRIALQRLRSSGLIPMPYARTGRATRDRDWEEDAFTPNVSGLQLAAALLIPITRHDTSRLAQLVLRPQEVDQLTPTTVKETQNHDD